jgi:hypothetical protein
MNDRASYYSIRKGVQPIPVPKSDGSRSCWPSGLSSDLKASTSRERWDNDVTVSIRPIRPSDHSSLVVVLDEKPKSGIK